MDETYFLDILRRREREIADEVERLRDASRSNRVGAEDVDRLAARLESVGSDLNDVRGFLADENLVLDVLVGAGMDPARALDELRERHETIRARNDAERRRVDAACGERKTSQTATEDLERQIATRREELKSRVENLPADRRREHEALESERGALAEAQAELEAELADVTDQCVAAERELAEDATRRRALALRDKLEASEAERDRVAREVEKLRLSPEDQRARLKEQIRADNAETAELEREAQQLQKQARALEGKLRDARADASRGDHNTGGPAGIDGDSSAEANAARADKLEKLLAQEKELLDFIANFEPERDRIAADVEARKAAVVAKLERVSRRVAALEEAEKEGGDGENGGGGAGDAGDSTRDALSELEFKRRQTDNASTTNDRLRAEKDLRREELEKVDALESKIAGELRSLANRAEDAKRSLASHGALDDVKREAEAYAKALGEDVRTFGARAEALRAKAAEMRRKRDAKRAQLESNAAHRKLAEAEARARDAIARASDAAEFARGREAEGDAGALEANLEGLVEEMNDELKRRARGE